MPDGYNSRPGSSNAGQALRDTRHARQTDQQVLDRLNEAITYEQQMITRLRGRIEQIHDRTLWQQLTHTPAERVRDRKELFGLEQRIVNHEAAITGIGFRVRRQERVIDRAEHRLGGRAGDEDRFDSVKSRTEKAIDRIDHVLNRDLEVRAQRVLDHGPDHAILERHRIDPSISRNNHGTLAQWATTIAQAEQHHLAWDSIDHDVHGRDTLGIAMQRSQRLLAHNVVDLDRTLHPPAPSLGIAPERGFGLSL